MVPRVEACIALSTRLRSAWRSFLSSALSVELAAAAHLEGHAGVGGARLEEERELACDVVRLRRADGEVVEPAREREEAFDDLLEALGLGGDDGEALLDLLVGRVARDVRGEALDRGERVLHLVGEPRGDALERARAPFALVAELLATDRELERDALVRAR